ncbi:hypothetical protein GCM10028820_22060 [Tessaracoccus terricola]
MAGLATPAACIFSRAAARPASDTIFPFVDFATDPIDAPGTPTTRASPQLPNRGNGSREKITSTGTSK